MFNRIEFVESTCFHFCQKTQNDFSWIRFGGKCLFEKAPLGLFASSWHWLLPMSLLRKVSPIPPLSSEVNFMENNALLMTMIILKKSTEA